MRPITPEDYPLLLELDANVYPTDNPVTPEILDVWYKNNPEFGMVFGDGPSGLCVAIPLTYTGWDMLQNL